MNKKQKEQKKTSASKRKAKEKKSENNNLEICRREREEYLLGWQRAKADFVNYKKDLFRYLQKEKANERTDVLTKIIESLDNFNLAIEQIPEKDKEINWVQGVIQIKYLFDKFLEEEGIEKINSIGENFNPNFHEAVEEVKSDKYKSGQIVEIISPGYLKGKQLLRSAKVKVSK